MVGRYKDMNESFSALSCDVVPMEEEMPVVQSLEMILEQTKKEETWQDQQKNKLKGIIKTRRRSSQTGVCLSGMPGRNRGFRRSQSDGMGSSVSNLSRVTSRRSSVSGGPHLSSTQKQMAQEHQLQSSFREPSTRCRSPQEQLQSSFREPGTSRRSSGGGAPQVCSAQKQQDQLQSSSRKSSTRRRSSVGGAPQLCSTQKQQEQLQSSFGKPVPPSLGRASSNRHILAWGNSPPEFTAPEAERLQPSSSKSMGRPSMKKTAFSRSKRVVTSTAAPVGILKQGGSRSNQLARAKSVSHLNPTRVIFLDDEVDGPDEEAFAKDIKKCVRGHMQRAESERKVTLGIKKLSSSSHNDNGWDDHQTSFSVKTRQQARQEPEMDSSIHSIDHSIDLSETDRYESDLELSLSDLPHLQYDGQKSVGNILDSSRTKLALGSFAKLSQSVVDFSGNDRPKSNDKGKGKASKDLATSRMNLKQAREIQQKFKSAKSSKQMVVPPEA